MTSWVATEPNLMPVGVDGGPARMAGWVSDRLIIDAGGPGDTTTAVLDAGRPNRTADQVVDGGDPDGDAGWPLDTPTYPQSAGGAAILDPGTTIWSTPVRASGVAVAPADVQEGVTYTAGVTVDQLAGLVLTWVTSSGAPGDSVDAVGHGRVTITAVAPPGTIGAFLGVRAPKVTLTGGDPDPDVRILRYPSWLADDDDPSLVRVVELGPVTVTWPTIIEGTRDRGPLPPARAAAALLWSLVPQVQRSADTTAAGPGLLRHYTDGISRMLDAAWDTIEQAPDLTSPTGVPTVWVPWLAEALGIPTDNAPTSTLRSAITAWTEAPTVGSSAAIAATTRRFLLGTKQALVQPAPPWVIYVGVRADECPQGTETLRKQVVATGQVPAGYVLRVVNVAASWAAVDAAYPLWRDSDGLTWAVVDSTGVTLS